MGDYLLLIQDSLSCLDLCVIECYISSPTWQEHYFKGSSSWDVWTKQKTLTIRTSCVILSNSYKKFAEDNGCCREKNKYFFNTYSIWSDSQNCLIHQKHFGFYILCRLIRWRCFSFVKCIRNGFVWKSVIFQDGEERTVPPVSGIWSFKSQH